MSNSIPPIHSSPIPVDQEPIAKRKSSLRLPLLDNLSPSSSPKNRVITPRTPRGSLKLSNLVNAVGVFRTSSGGIAKHEESPTNSPYTPSPLSNAHYDATGTDTAGSLSPTSPCPFALRLADMPESEERSPISSSSSCLNLEMASGKPALFYSNDPLTAHEFRKISRNLHKMRTKNVRIKEAAQLVFHCLIRPDGAEKVLGLLEFLYAEKKVTDYRWVLTAIFCCSAISDWEDHENQAIDLIYAFLTNQQIQAMDLADDLVEELIHREVQGSLVAKAFRLYIQRDMAHSDPILAIRSGTLSSYLHAKYCARLLPKLFFHLRSVLETAWEKRGSTMLSLECAKQYPELQEAIQENCRALFTEFLRILYNLSIPPFCEILLRNWRQEIYCHFRKDTFPEEASLESERQGELLFLKIINPYLMLLSKDPDLASDPYKKDLLKSVARMLQALSNQAPKEDLAAFDDVYFAFLHTHRQYINNHFALN